MKPQHRDFSYADLYFMIDRDFQQADIDTIKDHLWKLIQAAYDRGYVEGQEDVREEQIL